MGGRGGVSARRGAGCGCGAALARSVSRPSTLPPATHPHALQVRIDYRPVHLQPLDNEMEHIPPKPRVY